MTKCLKYVPYAMCNINISVDIDVFVHDIVRELNEAKTETTNDNYTRNNWCRTRPKVYRCDREMCAMASQGYKCKVYQINVIYFFSQI